MARRRGGDALSAGLDADSRTRDFENQCYAALQNCTGLLPPALPWMRLPALTAQLMRGQGGFGGWDGIVHGLNFRCMVAIFHFAY